MPNFGIYKKLKPLKIHYTALNKEDRERLKELRSQEAQNERNIKIFSRRGIYK